MAEEVKDMVQKIGDEWAEFRKANDERLAQIEKDGHASADIEKKVDEMSAGLGKLEEKQEKVITAMNRIGTGEAKTEAEEKVLQVKAATLDYLHTGRVSDELKELSVGSDPNGGYTVFPEIGDLIAAYASEARPIFNLANVVTISNADAWEAPAYSSNATSCGYVGELDARSETDTPLFKFKRIDAHEIYAEPVLTTKIAEDSSFDIEAFLAMQLGECMTETASSKFHIGAASNVAPRGFLTYSDGTTGWNDIEQIFSGSTSGFTSDKIIDLQAALKDAYQANATFLASRASIAALRKLKSPVTTSGGQDYLLVPDFANAAKVTMLGDPVIADPDMPAISSGSLSLAYGDFKRGYTIVNRRGLDVVRNPFRTSGKVIYQSTMRNGGDVTNFEAIKIMDCATS